MKATNGNEVATTIRGRPIRSSRTNEAQKASEFINSSSLIFDDSEGGTDEDEPPSKKTCSQPAKASCGKAKDDDSDAESDVFESAEGKYCTRFWIYGTYGENERYSSCSNEFHYHDKRGHKRKHRGKPEPKHLVLTLALPKGTIDLNVHYNPKKTSFMDLPGEIRNKCYRRIFVNYKENRDSERGRRQVWFRERSGFRGRSSAVLRANKAIYHEARQILYGRNRFVFEPSPEKYGELWEEDWKWAGYGQIRRFLTLIGPTNTRFIREIGISFEDATLGQDPGKTIDKRRFQNDEDVLWMLRRFAKLGNLKRLKIQFQGRKEYKIDRSPIPIAFDEALKSVKADELEFGPAHGPFGYSRHPNHINYNEEAGTKANPTALEELESYMIRGRPTPEPKERVTMSYRRSRKSSGVM